MVYGMSPFEIILAYAVALAALVAVVYLLVRVIKKALKK